MGRENRLYSISLGVASLQGGLVGVATALSPATCRPFQVFSPSFFIGLGLIIVSYGPGHSVHNEWVYNEADIDGAKVVWARDMDVAQNCNLVAYFRNRRTWSLEADGDQSVP